MFILWLKLHLRLLRSAANSNGVVECVMSSIYVKGVLLTKRYYDMML